MQCRRWLSKIYSHLDVYAFAPVLRPMHVGQCLVTLAHLAIHLQDVWHVYEKEDHYQTRPYLLYTGRQLSHVHLPKQRGHKVQLKCMVQRCRELRLSGPTFGG